MSDRFEAASGRRIVSRTSAEELGNLEHLVVDAKGLRVTALVVGKGRRASWSTGSTSAALGRTP